MSQEAFEAAGINETKKADEGQTEAIYNLNGVRQATLQKGINIVKTSQGVKKVYVK